MGLSTLPAIAPKSTELAPNVAQMWYKRSAPLSEVSEWLHNDRALFSVRLGRRRTLFQLLLDKPVYLGFEFPSRYAVSFQNRFLIRIDRFENRIDLHLTRCIAHLLNIDVELSMPFTLAVHESGGSTVAISGFIILAIKADPVSDDEARHFFHITDWQIHSGENLDDRLPNLLKRLINRERALYLAWNRGFATGDEKNPNR